MHDVHLPDCAGRRMPRVLSARQRRELVRVLAEHGAEGLEDWIVREQQHDPHIRHRIEKERARLEREARAERRRVEAGYQEERGQAASAWEKRMRRMTEREAELRDRLDDVRSQLASTGRLAERSALVRAATQQAERSLWQRVKTGLYRFWLWLVGLWVRLIRWITGRSRDQDPRATLQLPEGTRLDLPSLWASRPGLRVEVRRRIKQEGWQERMRRWWRTLTGREDYAEIARRLMQEEMEREKHKLELEQEAREEELEQRLQRIEQEEQEAERRREEDLEEIEQRHERELEELERRVEQEPLSMVRREVLEELEEAGLVTGEGSPTEALMQRFSNLLYEEAQRALPSGGQTTPGHYTGGEGEYERGPLRSLNERGHMDLVASYVNARTHHPSVRHIYDGDILVHREVRAANTHVVLILDRSGSMEEKGRFEAAKRVCLVMYKTVKDQDPDHRVDMLTLSTEAERVDLAGLWNAELGGFTNHGQALRRARDLLEAGGADRRLVYLITDGLPEAVTREDGQSVIDDPEVCLADATEAAAELGQMEGTRLMVIQLETEDPLYLEAAEQIAQAAGGEIAGLEPDQLTEELVLDFEEHTEPAMAL